MKKKLFISVGVLIVIVVLGIIIWNNRTVSIVTLDINPSIELRLNKDDKVKSVKALNKDAKEIITKDLKGNDLENSIKILADNLVDKGYAENGDIVVLIYSSGNVFVNDVYDVIRESFNELEINPSIIVVENISKEDIKLAKKNDISPAKAAYINSIIEDKKEVDMQLLISKPVNELLEVERTGRYCDDGYTLEGDFCEKEIKRFKASEGLVCPEGYFEQEGICYEDVPGEETGNLYCPSEFTMDGVRCVRTITREAIPSKFKCNQGEPKTRAEMQLTGEDAEDANYIVCIDTSNATHPVTPCELPADDPTERAFIGGKCYWHRAPVIESGCPGKIQVDGFCWDDASNVLICAGYRDGDQYSSRSEYCVHSIKYIDPVVTEYKCEDGYELKGNKCVREEDMDAMQEKICPAGYTLVDSGRCLNFKKSVDKEQGLVCNQDYSKLQGNTCIIYDVVDAHHS